MTRTYIRPFVDSTTLEETVADRTVKVGLVAEVSGYVAGMDKAASKTRELGADGKKTQAQIEAQGRAMTQVGAGLVAFGAVAVAAIGLAVVKFADFDEAISNVKAVTQESTENMRLLNDAALEFGASSVFTATEAANAIEELGKAGISTADILAGALAGSLNLASAGELDIARAAEIAATTLQQFGLSGDQASRVADTLAAGAGKALGSVDDLANGLKFVGPVAADMGVSLEETTAVLAMFAQQGIIGEQAGTGLRGMLSSLTSPSAQARKQIEDLGIQLYDGQGKFLGLENAAGELKDAYGPMTDAQRDASLGVIFGNQQITAARILYKGGAEGVAEWTGAVSESGYAAQVARDRLDNLKGDVEQLGGAFDTYLIKSGSAANGVLRDLVQGLTFLTEKAGALPQPMLNAGLAVGVVAAAVALTGGVALLAIPKIAEYRLALQALEIKAGTTALKIGLVGAAVGAAVLIFSIWVGEQAKAAAKSEAYASTFETSAKRITGATRDMIKVNLAAKQSWGFIEGSSTFDAAEKLGISLDLVTDAAMGNVDALLELEKATTLGAAGSDELAAQMAATGLTALELSSAVGYVTVGVQGESDSIAEAIRIAKQKQDADKGSAASSDTATEAYKAAADEVSGLNSELTSLIDTINEANGVGQDAVSQNIGYQDSLRDVSDQIAEIAKGTDGYSKGIKANTESGAENLGMLNDLAKKSQDAAQAQFDLDNDSAKFTATLDAGRQTLIDNAIALGASADEAENLADQIYKVPSKVEVEAIVNTADAKSAVQELKDSLAAFQNSNYGINVSGYMKSVERADGGPITGVGGPRQDNIPIMASVGEHMLDAEDVRRMGGHAGVFAMRESLYGSSGQSYSAPQYAAPALHTQFVQMSAGSDSGTTITIAGNVGYNPAELAAEIDVRKRKSIALSNLRGVSVA